MTDFASCFSQHAVQVSDTSCRPSYTHNSCIPQTSVQNAVTTFYRTVISTGKPLLAVITWTKHGFSVNFTDGDTTAAASSSAAIKLNFSSRFFRKQKGTKIVSYQTSKIEVFWDFSTARYESGPEPVSGFYLVINIDSELRLILGDKMRTGGRTGGFDLISRREHFSGGAVYSTRTRFGESGGAHDVLIRCSGGDGGEKDPVLSVCIDRKLVIRVKRLTWNFRGNRTVLVEDGLVIDLMWDVHDWFHGPESGYGVFMFRRRNGLEDEIGDACDEKIEFSLMIYVCKNF